jgi:surfeit locus 1 family protein
VIRFQPLPVMTVLCVLALALLIALGRWQWERYERKIAAEQEPLPARILTGYQPMPEAIQFVYGVRPDTREAGWRVFTPVQIGSEIVFVDGAFVPGVRAPSPREVRPPASLREGLPLEVEMVEPEPPGLFPRPQPDLSARRWYAVELERMGALVGLEGVANEYAAAQYVGADGRAVDNPFPNADEMPPARHLGYAVTWYGLALVLAVIYFAYHVSVGRLRLRPARAPEA